MNDLHHIFLGLRSGVHRSKRRSIICNDHDPLKYRRLSPQSGRVNWAKHDIAHVAKPAHAEATFADIYSDLIDVHPSSPRWTRQCMRQMGGEPSYKTRPGSARETRSLAAGPGAAPGLQRPKIRERSRPISLAPSALSLAKALAWSCRSATPRPCRCTWRRYRALSNRRPRRAVDGSSRMAHDRKAGSARQYQHRSAAAGCPEFTMMLSCDVKIRSDSQLSRMHC
jgi:hypothetical protein